ncbi:MAG: TetR/AcrR family transcriptional regulator [Chloroflexi bacterium]|nr:TetR/AcrR family transcriptional regulator [Chloroflexota bacterium]
MSRREKIRQSTIEEIKAIARRQMAETGTGSLSINALAREMEMTPSGFYRYFASRDDLVTDLIVDAYNSLGDAMETADTSQPRDDYPARMEATLIAYRAWGIEHPVDFELIFGTPIPNYQPRDDLTKPVGLRSLGVIFRILADALAAGGLHPMPEHLHLPPRLHVGLPASAAIPPEAAALPEVVVYVGLVGWSRLHGLLTLEIHRQMDHFVSDPEVFYHHEMRSLMRSVGMLAGEKTP